MIISQVLSFGYHNYGYLYFFVWFLWWFLLPRQQQWILRCIANDFYLLLWQLVELLDSPLHNYFKQHECLNYFFCFRWVLIQFKRSGSLVYYLPFSVFQIPFTWIDFTWIMSPQNLVCIFLNISFRHITTFMLHV